MKPEFFVEILQVTTLREIAGVWGEVEFLQILEILDYGDTGDLVSEELREMCFLSLQEIAPDDAAEILLRLHLGDKLSAGQIQNVAHEMLDEKLWEEYADIALHERLFNVGALLYQVFPSEVPRPDACCVAMKVQARNALGKDILVNRANESFYIRLAADGIDATSALRRMFEDQLVSRSFPLAEQIIWICNELEQTNESRVVELIGSGAWFATLGSTKSYTSHAFPDEVLK